MDFSFTTAIQFHAVLLSEISSYYYIPKNKYF